MARPRLLHARHAALAHADMEHNEAWTLKNGVTWVPLVLAARKRPSSCQALAFSDLA